MVSRFYFRNEIELYLFERVLVSPCLPGKTDKTKQKVIRLNRIMARGIKFILKLHKERDCGATTIWIAGVLVYCS